MATQLKARILNKISTWSEWEAVKTTFKPLRGEICIVEIPTGTSNTGLTPPATGIKVGDGEHFFGELPWVQATAGDVSAFVKTIDTEATFNSKVNTLIAAATNTSISDLNTAIDGLKTRMDTAEGKISALETTVGNASSGLVQTVNSHTASISSLSSNKADKTTVASDITAAKTAVLGEDSTTSTKTVKGAYEAAAQAQSKANENATNISGVSDRVGALETTVGNAEGGLVKDVATNAANISANASDISTIQGQIEEINEVIGGSDGTSINDRLASLEEKDEALVAEDARLAGLISNNSDAIGAEKTRAEGAEKALSDRLDTVEIFFESADNSTEVIDTLKEIQEYISSDKTGAQEMLAAIQQNKTAIESNDADIEALQEKDTELGSTISGIGDRVTAIENGYATDAELATAKSELIGTSSDASSKNTIYGAKKYAEEKAAAAQSAAETTAAADATFKANKALADAKEYTNSQISTVSGAIDNIVSGSSVADGAGLISALDITDSGLTASRRAITMADMSDTDTFVFYCGTASDVI